jgi:hypothetical protein
VRFIRNGKSDLVVKNRSFCSSQDFLSWAKKVRNWERRAILFDLCLGEKVDGISLAEQVPKQAKNGLRQITGANPKQFRDAARLI